MKTTAAEAREHFEERALIREYGGDWPKAKVEPAALRKWLFDVREGNGKHE